MESVWAALPHTKIVCVGPWWPRATSSSSQSILDIRDGIKAAAAARSVLFLYNIAETWMTGTGNTTNLQNDSNADIYTGPDNTPPTPAGHIYLGRRLAQAIAAALPL